MRLGTLIKGLQLSEDVNGVLIQFCKPTNFKVIYTFNISIVSKSMTCIKKYSLLNVNIILAEKFV